MFRGIKYFLPHVKIFFHSKKSVMIARNGKDARKIPEYLSELEGLTESKVKNAAFFTGFPVQI